MSLRAIDLFQSNCIRCNKEYKAQYRFFKSGESKFCSVICHLKNLAEKRGKNLKKQFYSKVLLPNTNGCMEWIGCKSKKGYGQFRSGIKTFLAHRYSYVLHYGNFPIELNVLHHCDNPKCVAPDHLFLGTYADNNYDRDRKGRFTTLRGQDNGHAKLTNQQVKEIKEKIKLGMKGVDIAKQYKCSTYTVSLIKTNKQWRHI